VLEAFRGRCSAGAGTVAERGGGEAGEVVGGVPFLAGCSCRTLAGSVVRRALSDENGVEVVDDPRGNANGVLTVGVLVGLSEVGPLKPIRRGELGVDECP
jgi:hypothetical protein